MGKSIFKDEIHPYQRTLAFSIFSEILGLFKVEATFAYRKNAVFNKSFIRQQVSTTPKNCFHRQEYILKNVQKIIGERLIDMEWLALNLNYCFHQHKTALSKKTTEKKSVSTSRKNCVQSQELKKSKKTGLQIISVMLSRSRKKTHRIKGNCLKITQNPYTLAAMKDFMKNPFSLAGKSCFHSQEYLKNPKVLTSRNNALL